MTIKFQIISIFFFLTICKITAFDCHFLIIVTDFEGITCTSILWPIVSLFSLYFPFLNTIEAKKIKLLFEIAEICS